MQVSFGNHVALLLSCWKKQKKFVIRKRPGGVFAATVMERDRAVWSPSPARAVALRRPGGSARCLGSRSAPPGLCACVALLGSEPSELWEEGGAVEAGAVLSTASAPCGPGPGVGVLFGSPPQRPREGAELPPSVTSSWGGGAGLPIQTRRSPPPQHPCGRRPARPALSVTGKVLALR